MQVKASAILSSLPQRQGYSPPRRQGQRVSRRNRTASIARRHIGSDNLNHPESGGEPRFLPAHPLRFNMVKQEEAGSRGEATRAQAQKRLRGRHIISKGSPLRQRQARKLVRTRARQGAPGRTVDGLSNRSRGIIATLLYPLDFFSEKGLTSKIRCAILRVTMCVAGTAYMGYNAGLSPLIISQKASVYRYYTGVFSLPA